MHVSAPVSVFNDLLVLVLDFQFSFPILIAHSTYLRVKGMDFVFDFSDVLPFGLLLLRSV